MKVTAQCERCAVPLAPRIVAIDLDGTLLGDGDAVDHLTVRRLARLSAGGTVTVVVTGRALPDAALWARRIAARYAVALNGGVLGARDGQPLWTAPNLPEAAVTALVREARARSVDIHLHTAREWYPEAGEMTVRAYARRHGLNVATTPRPLDTTLLAELIGPLATLDEICAAVPMLQSLAVTRVSDQVGHYLDVTAAGVDKSAPFVPILDLEQAGWTDVLAIGDGPNDRVLFGRARTAVAMWDADASLDDVATHRVDCGPDEGAVRVALAALIDHDEAALVRLECLHRTPSWLAPSWQS